jgi:hypothetical protein
MPLPRIEIPKETILSWQDLGTIVIVGPPKSGKSVIADQIYIQTDSFRLESDNYISGDFQGDLSQFMDDINALKESKLLIISGVQTPRLLRKGLEQKSFSPDVIVKIECDDNTIEYCYRKDGEEDKIKGALAMKKSLDTIYSEYISNLGDNEPIIYSIDTSIR